MSGQDEPRIRPALHGDDEEGLLQFQDEFKKSGEAPAARAVSSRPPPVAASSKRREPPPIVADADEPVARESLSVKNEDELLRVQEDFMKSGQEPSARMVPKNPAAAPPRQSRFAKQFAAKPAAAGEAPEKPRTRSVQPPVPATNSLISDVLESWPTEAPQAPSIKAAPAPVTSGGFPAAMSARKAPALGRAAASAPKSAVKETPEEEEHRKIHEENERRVDSMSLDEIESAQDDIAHILSPQMIESIKRHGIRRFKAAPAADAPSDAPSSAPSSATAPGPAPAQPAEDDRAAEQSLEDAVRKELHNLVPDHEKWFRGITVESSKLAWTLPLPPKKAAAPNAPTVGAISSGIFSATDDEASAARFEDMLRERSSGEALVVALRFDFDGHLVEEGRAGDGALHHHGEQPDKPGYTLNELAQLQRSAVPSQRVIAIRALRHIVDAIKAGAYDEQTCVHLVDHFIGDPMVTIFAVDALNDRNESVMMHALRLVHALVCSPAEAETMLRWRLTRRSPLSFWFGVTNAQKDAVDLGADLIANLLHAGVVQSLSRVLQNRDFLREIDGADILLQTLARLARHSPGAAAGIIKTQGLLQGIVNAFVAVPWPALGAASVANPHAIDVMCAIAESGAKAADELVAVGGVHAVSRYIIAALPAAASPADIERAAALKVHSLLLLEALAMYPRVADMFGDLTDALNTSFVTEISSARAGALPSVGALRVAVATLRYYTAVAPLLPEHVRCGALWPQLTTLLARSLEVVQHMPASAWQLRSDGDVWGVYLVSQSLYFAAVCHRVAMRLPFYAPPNFAPKAEELWDSAVNVSNAWLPLLLSRAASAARAVSETSSLLSPAFPSLAQLGRFVGGYMQLPGLYRPNAAAAARHIFRRSAPHDAVGSALDFLQALSRLSRGLVASLAVIVRSPLFLDTLSLAAAMSAELRPLLGASKRVRALAGGHVHSQQAWLAACDEAGAALWTAMDADFTRVLFSTLMRVLRDAPPGHERAVVAAMQMLHRAEYIAILAMPHERTLFQDVQAFVQPSWANAFATSAVVAAMRTATVPPDYDGSLTFHLAELKTPPQPDFVFRPIQIVFDACVAGAVPTDANDDDLQAVRANLAFAAWMTRELPEVTRELPPAARIMALMRVFLISDDIFFKPYIEPLLASLIGSWLKRGECDESATGGVKLGSFNFQTLALEFVKQFAAVSYHQPTFARLVVALLNTVFPADLRVAIWTQLLASLHVLSSLGDDATPMPFGRDGYMSPLDTDERLITAYARALLHPDYAVKSGLIYDIAVHHVRAFLAVSGAESALGASLKQAFAASSNEALRAAVL